MIKRPPGRSCLILLFLLPLFLQFPQRAFTEPLSLEAYRFRIQEAINTLEAGEGTLGPKETSHLRDKLPPGLAIQSSEKEEVRVDRSTLLMWIRKAQESPEGRSQLITHLKALHEQLKPEEGALLSESEWKAYRAGLEEVYRLREFRHLKENQRPPWLEFFGKLLDRIRKWLGDHLGAIGRFGGPWTLYAVYGMVLLLGGFILVRIILRSGSLGWRWRQARLSTFESEPVPSSPSMDWRGWREQAREMALQGAFREAVRALFVSVLMEGHQRGWWLYEVEATNREHLARVGGGKERYEALEQLIHLYERAWYGLGQPGREVYQSCEDLVKRMEAPA